MTTWVEPEKTFIIKDSIFRSKVVYLENTGKFIVHVWEFTRQRTSKARALNVARKAIARHAIVNADNTLLLDHEIDKKVSDSHGVKQLVHIRQSSFVFSEVN